MRGQDLSGKEAEKKAEVYAKEAGATFDRTVCPTTHPVGIMLSVMLTGWIGR